MILTDDIKIIKGLGPKKAKALNDHGINKVEDLLFHIPYDYEDRRNVTPIFHTIENKKALIQGKVVNKKYNGFRKKNSLLILYLEDSSGIIELVFFNGHFINQMVKRDDELVCFGTVTYSNGFKQMIHPEFSKVGDSGDIRDIVAVYRPIDKITTREIRKWIHELKPIIEDVEEWLPEKIIEDNNMCGLSKALELIHFPQYGRQVLEGKYRLIFDELLTLELGLFYIKNKDKDDFGGISKDGSPIDVFIKDLPFNMTEGQLKALSDIRKDMESNRIMNRLVQGDVGSGKTVVAEAAMMANSLNGFQSVMMAPTEILARQHFNNISKDMEKYGLKVCLLLSKMSSKAKKEALASIESGECNIIIGTHAVISESVKYNNLGLVVTDEQHRFGVRQRNLLSEKGDSPDILVMTATPIPRTLAVILYGDLDISQIRTMPKGRKSIITKTASDEVERSLVYEKVKEEIQKGRQAYVVAPLIEESEVVEAKSAEELHEELSIKFKSFNVGLLHGAMSQDEKDSIMDDFYKGTIDILVSTVVIEVGINVPNATIMVIENSERFGLAQMHQLRGRVGRGEHQSYCFVVISKSTEIALERATVLSNSSDGFFISEEDLRLRGPGDIFGTRQHGLPEMHMADLVKHIDILEKAKNLAKDIIDDDKNLSKEKNKLIREKVESMFGDKIQIQI